MKSPTTFPGDFSGDVPEFSPEEEKLMLASADAELSLRKGKKPSPSSLLAHRRAVTKGLAKKVKR